MLINDLKLKVLNGGYISRDEATEMIYSDLDELRIAANEIRDYYCKNQFDICSIINGKSGKCSEDCKYCAQSVHHSCKVEEYPLLDADVILKNAKYNEDSGVLRYSIVTSGRSLSDEEIEKVCSIYKVLAKSSKISLCASHGLLSYEQLLQLKEAGVVRYHNNLETSRRFFPNVCTTHTYDDKIATIKNAQRAGLSVCSGGIFGLGENMEDRIDMALELRELGIRSVPINILNPIQGTPFGKNHILTVAEAQRVAAIYRFILPDASLRLAGGRGLMADKGRSLLLSGANATISGDMLTTAGISIEQDLEMVNSLGFEVVKVG
ncbi:biotin synthase BioB [Selenomonadales bacterium OttesenSCG-928-I06]|nr:biotin synthase BioB [Selenomonadales bacterium OttesenSCG-928-I06]